MPYISVMSDLHHIHDDDRVLGLQIAQQSLSVSTPARRSSSVKEIWLFALVFFVVAGGVVGTITGDPLYVALMASVCAAAGVVGTVRSQFQSPSPHAE